MTPDTFVFPLHLCFPQLDLWVPHFVPGSFLSFCSENYVFFKLRTDTN